MAARDYSSSLDSEYNGLTVTLIPPHSLLSVPRASKQESSQQSPCAFSYADFMSLRNNLMLEKSPNRKQKSTFQLFLLP